MTTNTEGAPDPQTGRFAVWIAGGLGIAAIVAYGSYQAQQRLVARDRAPAAAEGRTQAPATPEQLMAKVGAAAGALDVEMLASLDRELETAAARTTQTEIGNDLRVARASALSVRALEAAIRAHRSGDSTAAKTELATMLVNGRALTDTLARSGVSPASVARIEARLDLAEGHDITLIHPVVLLPHYPDPELRLAALSRPLFRDGVEFADGELDSLTTALEGATPPTGLSRLLLAMALERAGDTAGAKSQARAVLSQTPGQPLALAMQSPPNTERGAAVGDPRPDGAAQDSEPPTPDQTPASETAEPKPAATVEPVPPPKPVPEPSTAPSPAPAPKTAEKPKPASSAGSDGTKPKPAKPKAAKPKAAKPKAAKPKASKPKAGFDALLAEGCKLVRSGDPGAGFNVLKKAHDIKPGGARVTLCMAQAQDKLGRAASALALVDRVLRKSPNNKTALLLAARLESAQGNKTTAETYYRKVLTLDPDNAKAKKFLGEK